MELPKEARAVLQMPNGLLCVFGTVVSFPFNEVLDFSVRDLFVEYPFWFIFFFVHFDV